MSRDDLLVVAGETSGDLHAARLVDALMELQPGLRPFGLGSRYLEAAGVELLADSSEIAVVGISEALSILERARELFDRILAEVERRRPRVAVLVDYPEFNLRLARELRWRGVRVAYYVSPQIWAWRPWRVRTIAESVDRMLVLFGFEVDFYTRHSVDAVHVGHPLVDEVPFLQQAWERVRPGALPDRFEIALLPGSRRGEVASLLAVQISAAALLAKEIPLRVRIVRAPSIDRSVIDAALASAATGLEVEIVDEDRFEAIAGSHLAICASGTATLETGLLGTPLLVVYRLTAWTWRIAKLLVRVPYASLVNLVLGRPAVPELLQESASPEGIAREALAILRSRTAVDSMRTSLAELRPRLGRAGASSRAAAEVVRLLDELEPAA